MCHQEASDTVYMCEYEIISVVLFCAHLSLFTCMQQLKLIRSVKHAPHLCSESNHFRLYVLVLHDSRSLATS
jgi:hypothetical protein